MTADGTVTTAIAHKTCPHDQPLSGDCDECFEIITADLRMSSSPPTSECSLARHLGRRALFRTYREVVSAVAGISGVPIAQIVGVRRMCRVVQARHAAALLLREDCGASYPEIARILGGRDHSTMVVAVRVAAHKVRTGGPMAALVGDVRARLAAA